jgi:hypothetical protein
MLQIAHLCTWIFRYASRYEPNFSQPSAKPNERLLSLNGDTTLYLHRVTLEKNGADDSFIKDIDSKALNGSPGILNLFVAIFVFKKFYLQAMNVSAYRSEWYPEII